MRNINELIGIIKGINFDGVINDMEVARLQMWVDKNRNLSFGKTQMTMIKMLDKALEDHIITDDERKQLLIYSEGILNNQEDDLSSDYELNGIIEGIICDNELNLAEVIRLKQWLEKNSKTLYSNLDNKIIDLIENIISGEVNIEEVQNEFLQLLRNRNNDNSLQIKIEYLKRLVRERKNIGLDLIDILDNRTAIEYIHREAEEQLRRLMLSYSGIILNDTEIIFISLCLIGMLEYDGTYYENVRNTYEKLYNIFSDQKIEGTIRTILSKYRTSEEKKKSKSRIINVALSNAIVPAHFLPAFFDFIYDIYKLNLEYDIPEDIYEQFQFVYDGLRLNMLSDGDDIQVNVTKKSYKLIKTTKQLIVDGKYLDSVINLSIIIVKLIDKRIWNKDIVIYNPYLKMGFGNWEKTLSKTDTGKQHKNTTNELRSRWEPKFKLLNNNVFLVLPIHRVKAIFNYKDIRVKIKNGKEIIFFDDKPDIREIIGGYQVSVQNVKINNPLGELQYTILTENEIIYDSKNKLHRDFIVFDENGDEIKNNTDYKGIVVVCAYEEELPYQKYFKTNLYCLGSNKVSYEDTFIIKNEIFSFSSLVKPGVFGEKIPRLFLKKINTNNLFPVFSKVNFLVFENSNNNEKYEIIINGRSYRLTDFK